MQWYIKAWKKYAVFSGRASRKEYWMFVLYDVIFVLLIALIAVTLDPESNSDQIVSVDIYNLVTFIPAISAGCRRMHDIGRSGWWMLVPIISFFFLIEKGDRGSNKYGPNPLTNEVDTIY